MAHQLVEISESVQVAPGSVVSKVVHRGGGLNVTVFGFDAGEGLTEHRAARPAVVEVISGRLRFSVDGEELELVPGRWLHMEAGAPHALEAKEPSVMLLTLLPGSGPTEA